MKFKKFVLGVFISSMLLTFGGISSVYAKLGESISNESNIEEQSRQFRSFYEESLDELENEIIAIDFDFVDGQEIVLFYEEFELVIKNEIKGEQLARAARNFDAIISIYDKSNAQRIWIGDIRKTAAGTSGGGWLGTGIGEHTQISIHAYDSRTIAENPITYGLRVDESFLTNNGSDRVMFETNFSFRQDNGVTKTGFVAMALLPNSGGSIIIASGIIFFGVLLISFIVILAVKLKLDSTLIKV